MTFRGQIFILNGERFSVRKTKEKMTMMKFKLMTAAVVLAGIAGAATGDAAATAEARHDERRAAKRVYPQAIRLKSIFGINDAFLSDTNRFVVGERFCGISPMTIKFDKPFGGFREAKVQLEEERLHPGDRRGGRTFKLGKVILRRELDAVSDKELTTEWQSACDFVAGILNVASPSVKLSMDMEKTREKCEGEGSGPCSRFRFRLYGKQCIDVSLTEPLYVFRQGKLAVVNPACVEIDLINDSDRWWGRGLRRYDDIDADVEIEAELDFGPDYSSKLKSAGVSPVWRSRREREQEEQAETLRSIQTKLENMKIERLGR